MLLLEHNLSYLISLEMMGDLLIIGHRQHLLLELLTHMFGSFFKVSLLEDIISSSLEVNVLSNMF